MARPTKLTPEKHQRIVELIRAGNYAETATTLAGIGKQTYYTWMQKGEGPKARSPYREFRDAVLAAKAEAEARMVTVVQRAALDGSWQAASWYLERTQQAKFGKRQGVEVSGPNGDSLRVEVSVEDLEARIAELLE